MAEIIKMPKLSDTMEEGVVAKWHKQVGDTVLEGDLLAEIETDKATMEYESFQEGVILHHGVLEGGSAAIDSVLAIVGKKGEDFSALINGQSKEIESPNGAEIKSSPTEPVKQELIDTSSIPATIVKMPKLSDTMTEGTVAAWHKNVGDKVESGEILAEIETDKATMEFESFEDGVLLHQAVEAGNSAEVDSLLAIIGEEGTDFSLLIKSAEQGQSQGVSQPEENVIQEEKKTATAIPAKAPVSSTKSNGRLMISPLAQKMAKEKNIDPNQVSGSGDGGRIIKRDIENFVPVSQLGSASASAASHGSEDVPVSQMRKTIAKRLGESKFSAPHFYLTIDLAMENAMEARKAINAMPDTKVSFNDLVIKAAAAALKKHPQVNSSWQDDHITTHHDVHVGVAVAVEDGLLVPVVRNADTKQLSQITSEVKDFAKRAREKKLQPQDWEGSTFSISNLGMFGIEEFTAIINPPNACILAVGAIRETPVVKNGELAVGQRMKVTLSCDHRVVDGASGAEFLNTFKTYIENPVTILG